MAGVVATQKRLDGIQPEAGLMGSIKGVALEDVQNLKKTALEYYVLNERMRNLSVKYVKLKSKVPSEAEKLETAKKPTTIKRLETEKERLEAILSAHGLDTAGQDVSREKDIERYKRGR